MLNFFQGALGALQKICEDSADRLNQNEVNAVVSKMLHFFNSSMAKFRGLSLNTVNCILLVQNEAIGAVIDPFLERLFQLANDTDPVILSCLFHYVAKNFYKSLLNILVFDN